MQKLAIIGGGISGLTLGKLLASTYDVVIFEKENRVGGLIKCDKVNGSLFHTCGGHVFNTKNQEVLDFFWQQFNRDEEFVKSDRNAVVFMPNGKKIPYPIENHAYAFDDSMLANIIEDILALGHNSEEPTNFKEFLLKRFGKTLYDHYFGPYNAKIWKSDLAHIPLSWLDGKLPMPTPGEILYNNIRKVEEKTFVHATFWYERTNGSQHIADKMAKGQRIRYNMSVEEIEYDGSQWCVSGERFDKVVFCGNIKQLPKMTTGVDLGRYTEEINRLESHGTTSVFCEIEPNPYSWIYLPDTQYDAHRIICTGNFSASNDAEGKHTGTVEFTDQIEKEEIEKQLQRMPLRPIYITHKYNPTTYPIQKNDTRRMISSLRDDLASNDLYLCGRFAEWEYYNMDKAMESAFKVARTLGTGR